MNVLLEDLVTILEGRKPLRVGTKRIRNGSVYVKTKEGWKYQSRAKKGKGAVEAYKKDVRKAHRLIRKGHEAGDEKVMHAAKFKGAAILQKAHAKLVSKMGKKAHKHLTPHGKLSVKADKLSARGFKTEAKKLRSAATGKLAAKIAKMVEKKRPKKQRSIATQPAA